MKIINRQFVAYFHFVGFDNINLGISLCFSQPNIEIHLPFGFLRIGWLGTSVYLEDELEAEQFKTFYFIRNKQKDNSEIN